MNIILLSGGSGKRLWPLSNDIRSKQFIKLFKTENGYESMVQRVYRQIVSVDKNAGVTIATSKPQVSAIRNQLGDKVDICIEPCRRDTFPAIALAAVYLFEKHGLSENDVVTVCPVDPYVDKTYYEAVKRLSEISAENAANITLMGIEPTYPSEKYGYIIPQNSEAISPVSEFKEKPSTESAKKYIEKGALWNAGVFAFRLKYIIEKVRGLIDFKNYDELFEKYEILPKISFDYAVAEKEKSINVMRYSGEWRDVGTWNTMTEVMDGSAKGNVILDDKCRNTHVVNELGIPVLCMGCENMVIAASGDGILVSDKERSGSIKPYVEKIDNDVMFAEKSWGTYTVIDVQKGSMTVKIDLEKGSAMKYHCHELRSEVWTVVSGCGRVIIDDIEKSVSAGDVIEIPRGVKHTVSADTDMCIIEVQIGESISGKDKKVFEDKRV